MSVIKEYYVKDIMKKIMMKEKRDREGEGVWNELCMLVIKLVKFAMRE